ncbi:MAG: homoserine O-acetyltransferase [Acidimicrobiales bacterium]|nr:homoserine O-acetyltransferase [Acidimicrobiales bacterium]
MDEASAELPDLAPTFRARLPSDLPATGAWQPGDQRGDRQFFVFGGDRRFALEMGGSLPVLTIAYETWGELNTDASNAVLVCHALTGDSHAAGPMSSGHLTEGWWNDFVGPGRYVDTDRYFVVCANVLGGCQGSTGPASVNPDTGRRYGADFPVVTVRDVVRTQQRLADHLGIARWHTVVGGSMGGMQALEWSVMYPDRLRSMIVLASTAAASPQQIAHSAVGRLAIAADPRFRGGEYYDAKPGEGPGAGLMVARQIAQITYRTDETFARRFGRKTVDPLENFGVWGRFEVESYLDHHGQKLVRRFDANSYIILNRLMDLHDVGRGRGGTRRALANVRVPALAVTISSDALYPPRQQRELVYDLRANGVQCEYEVVDSPEGHDGFLLEHDSIGPILADFLATV